MKSPQASTIPQLAGLHDEDFFEWTQRNAELLRAGEVTEADIAHIAEEIEDLGKADWKEVGRRVRRVLVHLLRWRFEPGVRSRSRLGRIVAQRIEIELVLKQSPSLEAKIHDRLTDIYAKAVRSAAAEIGRGHGPFPRKCPFTVEQILDSGFMPKEAE